MTLHTHTFVQLLFTGFIALFPVINPIGSALMVNPYLSKLEEREKKIAVRKITAYSFLICIVSLFVGHWILQLFGISIPVIQLAGGIMICKLGWDALSDGGKKTDLKADGIHPAPTEKLNIHDHLFYPLAFPVTTGGGTIAVLFTLSAHSANQNFRSYALNTLAIVAAIIILCLLVFIFYSNTRKLIRRLGPNGEKVVNRISAFLIFCVGLQIAVTGIKDLM